MTRRDFLARVLGSAAALVVLPKLEAAATELEPGLRLVRIDEIRIDHNYNIRGPIDKKSKAYKALKDSIESVGVLTPIIVSTERVLLDGFYRVEAARAIGREYIPALVIHHQSSLKQLAEVNRNAKKQT